MLTTESSTYPEKNRWQPKLNLRYARISPRNASHSTGDYGDSSCRPSQGVRRRGVLCVTRYTEWTGVVFLTLRLRCAGPEHLSECVRLAVVLNGRNRTAQLVQSEPLATAGEIEPIGRTSSRWPTLSAQAQTACAATQAISHTRLIRDS